MSDLFFGKRKTIFDILEESDELKVIKEAPEDGDEGSDAGAGDAGVGDAGVEDSGAEWLGILKNGGTKHECSEQ